jgi:hypothetical protein
MLRGYGISYSFAHASCRQAVSNCALASSMVDTRSERVIGQVTVNDQNQRRWSGPPQVRLGSGLGPVPDRLGGRGRSPNAWLPGPNAQSYRVKLNGVSLSPGGRRKDTRCQSGLTLVGALLARKPGDGSLKHDTEH